MDDVSGLERMERERTTLFAEATQIVQTAETQSRKVTAKEDVRVLELMEGVRTLEERIEHLKRHHEPDQPQNRRDKQ